jgi:5-hydroxyisourate hydrolase-like protein (transthyretin family)
MSQAGEPLENIAFDEWPANIFCAPSETDSDGRNGTLMAAGTAIDKNSIFKLTFYTREYFNAKNIKSFYPFVEVGRSRFLHASKVHHADMRS